MIRRDHYQLLGVKRTASVVEIRSAYARLVKRHHPDAAGSSELMTRRLTEFQRAYRCLADPDSRAEHDRALDEAGRDHIARQHRLQRRLQRYDRRHPRYAPQNYGRLRWRRALLIAAGVLLATRLTGTFLG